MRKTRRVVFCPLSARCISGCPRTVPACAWISGVQRGDEVSPYYDPMLAKLIVRGETRAESLARMEQALRGFHVLGVQTNIPYLLAILRHPAFRDGAITTGFLAEHFARWQPDTDLPADVLLALAAETLLDRGKGKREQETGSEKPFDPWRAETHWRNS